MPRLDTSLAFFATAVLLGLSPGPDNLFVMTQAATQGRRAGWLVTAGLCAGLLGHTAAVALGLAAVLAASPAAFKLLEWLGAGYLLYLAWVAVRAPIGPLAISEVTTMRPWRMVARGLVMNLSNPKVAIFFLAFLPQFVQEGAGPVAFQIACLGALFMLATLLVFGSLAWFAGGMGSKLRQSDRLQRVLNLCAATVFLGLAVRLAWSGM